MDFLCYLCNKTFINLTEAIKHLKKTHSITDNTSKIKCLVNFEGNKCGREYLSFKAMRSHALVCVKNKHLLANKMVIK